MTDPRLGLPSASNSERYAHCQGSFLAGRGMPDNSTADSELGDRGHHALACLFRGDEQPLAALPEDEFTTCERCVRGVQTVLDDLGASLSDNTAKVAMVERRLWLQDDGERVGSGQADLVVMLLNQPAYVIFDFKLLYGQTSPAESNYQLRSLAALLRETLGDDKSIIYASIVAPNQSRVPSVVRYDYDASLVALRATVALFRGAIAGGARTPGDWCRYCPALGTCAEAQQAALVKVQQLPIPAAPSLEQAVSKLPGNKLAAFLDEADFALDVIAAAKAEAKRRLDLDPDSLPGYRLKPGAVQTTIRDLETVFARFIALGGTQQQYLGAMSAGKEKLSNALREATGLKGEALQEKMEQLIAGCTESKQKASSLERVKP